MEIWDSILDALNDTAKLLPFLFLTYLVMEYLEQKTSDKLNAVIRRADKYGPFFGGLLGAIPQCGFSTASASLYSGAVITAGTLIAVFLSTSDEMLPIFLSNHAPTSLILKVLGIKIVYGMAVGFLVDLLARKKKVEKKAAVIQGMDSDEHCNCGENIVKSAVKRTLSISLNIFLITLALNLLISFFGIEHLENLILNRPVIGELLSALVGLIPNCAASVAITTLYLDGMMSSSAMLAGLLSASGVGILVLFQTNRSKKDSVRILTILYAAGVIGGMLNSFLHLI